MINTLIVTPLINILLVLYSTIPGHDFGIAVIIFTILIKIALWPFAAKALRGQRAMQELQPEIQKLKKRYGKNKQEFNKAVMELYKEKEVNPAGSCFPMLAQFPFLIGMFYAFSKFKDPAFISLADPNSGVQALLYDSIKNLSPVKTLLASGGSISTTFLGVVDLAKMSIPIAVFAAAMQFLQTKMLTPGKDRDQAQQVMNQITYILPIVTFVFALSLPSAIPLYWAVQAVFSIFQQYWIMNKDVSFLEHLKSSVGVKNTKS